MRPSGSPSRLKPDALHMARLAGCHNRLEGIPFDFHELIGARALGMLLIVAPLHDANFQAESVGRIIPPPIRFAQLYGKSSRLNVEHPDRAHDFPTVTRERRRRFSSTGTPGEVRVSNPPLWDVGKHIACSPHAGLISFGWSLRRPDAWVGTPFQDFCHVRGQNLGDSAHPWFYRMLLKNLKS